MRVHIRHDVVSSSACELLLFSQAGFVSIISRVNDCAQTVNVPSLCTDVWSFSSFPSSHVGQQRVIARYTGCVQMVF